MTYPTNDTQWEISRKGNWWRRKGGVALIVGERRDGRYWARRGNDFMQGSYGTVTEAKRGAESNTPGEEVGWAED